MSGIDQRLRDKVRLLGHALGSTIECHLGTDMLHTIEVIRQQAMLAQSDANEDRSKLIDMLKNLPDDSLLPVVRGFNQFLNLSNLAEQQHKVSWRSVDSRESEPDFFELIQQIQQKVPHINLSQEIMAANIEVVLTAHPTEVTRRTLIQKYDQLMELLQKYDDLSTDHPQHRNINAEIEQLIDEIWHTDEIRQIRPTAVDEAKWGFTVIEQSLWQAIPAFIRKIDHQLTRQGYEILPISATPITFASWMGGDRDGNPNVTAAVTREVLWLARWKAADLFQKDIDRLGAQLSMSVAAPSFLEKFGTHEPYRACLHAQRDRLIAFKHSIEKQLLSDQNKTESSLQNFVVEDSWSIEELRPELEHCYQSLMTCNMEKIANGLLLDSLRRVACFGDTLIKLDIRQESTRHTDAIAAICDFYDYGDYRHWTETEKQKFLLNELINERPLIPHNWSASAEVQEVLDTCKILAEDIGKGISNYVISMATNPSDILAVILLLRATGVQRTITIVPLFETLKDLETAPETMTKLWSIDWYRQYCGDCQQIMIGYSDSAKDAGQLAAVWAQYKAQSSLTLAAKQQGIQLCLFHGRGGSVGRGGGPAHRGILSQPPGSVAGGFRVTEQGEMIRFKFGTPALAEHNFNVYLAAILEAKLLPPSAAKPEWQDLMAQLTQISVQSYRRLVQQDVNFLHYFESATPLNELSKLALGSRPARRKNNDGIQSLRAIPWIFAWTQMRLMVPTWLGADEAFAKLTADADKLLILQSMYCEWSFFTTYIDMLEMVLCKTNDHISTFYEQQLVDAELHPIGEQLRRRLKVVTQQVLLIKQQDCLIADNHVLQQSLSVRNAYTDPLHYLQVELLDRSRRINSSESDNDIEQALKVTMAGIAAGMRNTG